MIIIEILSQQLNVFNKGKTIPKDKCQALKHAHKATYMLICVQSNNRHPS